MRGFLPQFFTINGFTNSRSSNDFQGTVSKSWSVIKQEKYSTSGFE